MSVVTAREAAFRVLERCRRDGAWSGVVMDRVIREGGLEKRDAALATRLCLGVLQNERCLDYYIGLVCESRLQPKVRDLLRLGLYQLLFLDKIPERAAVSESVSLCKKVGCERAAGLVNAVLRRLAAQRQSLPEIPGIGSAAYLGIRYSHPDWLAKRLIAQHGYDFTESFFAANNGIAHLHLQVNTLKVGVEDYKHALLRTGIVFAEDSDLPGCLVLDGGNVSELPGYDEGLFYVQDKAARAAVCIAGARPGMRVLDACAAPGGKSFAAAIAMDGQGSILARDIHEKKLRLIQSGARRLGIESIETRAGDAREPDAALRERFDLVLADVPCSGLGVIAKRPEIRRKSEEEIAPLPEVQRAILRNLADCVKPGGVLLYSTCTVLEEENQQVVRWFLQEDSRFAPEDFSLGTIRSRDGCYHFWPQIDGTDGFFTARLRRKQ